MTLKVYDRRFRDGSTEMLYVSTDPLQEPSLEAGAAVREDLCRTATAPILYPTLCRLRQKGGEVRLRPLQRKSTRRSPA